MSRMSSDVDNVNRKDKVIALSKSIEPTLRTLAWLLPGRFDDSELVAEMSKECYGVRSSILKITLYSL